MIRSGGKFAGLLGYKTNRAMYFYRTYTSTLSGSTTRRERCVACSRIFEYGVTCTGVGGGHSAYFLANTGAAAIAKKRARDDLNRKLVEEIVPVHCPSCGIYQPDMVRVLREEHGKQYDPNQYASQRLAIPVGIAWRDACAANTVDAYRI